MLTTATKNNLRYRGYYYEAYLELYFVGTRCYDAKTGRWLNADDSLYHSMLGYNMYAYCNNNPVMYVDHSGQSGTLAVLAGAKQAVIAAGLFIGLVWLIHDATHEQQFGKAVSSIVDAIKRAIMSMAEADSEEAPKSITEPKSEDGEGASTSKNDKDSRLRGNPGDINKEGYKETHIGPDGRADKERHWTQHSGPKSHSNPHDHDIQWDEDGHPHFGPPNNYWDGNIPIFP